MLTHDMIHTKWIVEAEALPVFIHVWMIFWRWDLSSSASLKLVINTFRASLVLDTTSIYDVPPIRCSKKMSSRKIHNFTRPLTYSSGAVCSTCFDCCPNDLEIDNRSPFDIEFLISFGSDVFELDQEIFNSKLWRGRIHGQLSLLTIYLKKFRKACNFSAPIAWCGRDKVKYWNKWNKPRRQGKL